MGTNPVYTLVAKVESSPCNEHFILSVVISNPKAKPHIMRS